MKIVIAPDSFKGSLSAFEVAKSIQRGIANVDENIETIIVPLADGGEGTVQSLIDASGGKIVDVTVHDPLYREIESFYGIMGDAQTAVIEMAAASGLPLLALDERNPLKATSYGTGELIKDALDRGCRNFIIGLGGSATNDGGCGMAKALGARFLDGAGNDIELGGGNLLKINSIDFTGLDSRIKDAQFLAACDVDNPLCGAKGASEVYGRQKGASDEDVAILDKGLHHFAQIVKQQLNLNIEDVAGAGAAGGMGAGVLIFLQAKLRRGFEIVSEATHLHNKLEGADLVISGEGRIDFQTAFGKTLFGVAEIVAKKHIPLIVLAGSLGEGYKTLYNKGFTSIFSIIDNPMSLADAIANTPLLLENAAENVVRLWISKK
jgi:glycerate kinase